MTPPAESHSLQSQVSRVGCSTLIVIAGSALAFPISLLRQRIVAGVFGTSVAYDAYTAADGLSELLVTTLAAGTLAYAFVPIYVELLEHADRAESNRLVSQVINAIALAASIIAILCWFLAPAVAQWIAPGFSAEAQRLLAQSLQILLISTVIFSISSIVSQTLHAHQHFWLPAVAPIAYHIGIIFGAKVLSPYLGIFGLAWGAVIGSLLHLASQLPALWMHRVQWHSILNLNDPLLRRVFWLMTPRIFDLFLARASITFLNTYLGSFLSTGRLSALGYALRLMNIPWTLIGTALGFAVFPVLSSLASQNDLNAQRKALVASLRAVLIIALPAAIGLIVLGKPLIRLLFQGGEFTAESTELVFFALQFSTLMLISQSLLDIVVRVYAAQQDTWTPLLVSIATTALNVALAYWLARPAAQGGLEHGGLALANGIAVGVEVTIGLIILYRRWHGFNVLQVLRDVGRALVASMMMWAVVRWVQLGNMSDLALVGIGTALGIASYFACLWLLGVKDVVKVPLQIWSRLMQRETSIS
jgi:putative peptidoglycan lipid II flippase